MNDRYGNQLRRGLAVADLRGRSQLVGTVQAFDRVERRVLVAWEPEREEWVPAVGLVLQGVATVQRRGRRL